MKVESKSLFQTHFSSKEFSKRRESLMNQVEDEAIVIIIGKLKEHELETFRQSNNFFYMSGVEVPGAILTIQSSETTLYLPAHDPQEERTEGPRLNADRPDQVAELTGVSRVRHLSDLEKDLSTAKLVYTDQPNMEEICPDAETRPLSPFLRSMRMIKSSEEIEVMRTAGQLTAMAVTEAMRSTRVGLIEYQLGAIADYVFRLNGARGGGYPAIIASGPNAWYGHYFQNNSLLTDGDLILMDYAPDYAQYTSDIGRMWPVNGTFTSDQRQLYGFIVEYHKALLKRIGPGEMATAIMDQTATEMKAMINQMTFTKSHYEKAVRDALEFRGHLSHSVGMDVHDHGNYREQPLQPGLVFSVDPMIWVPEEKLYIRVEDTVLVTENGIDNLTQMAPLELDDVEETMKSAGMIDMLSHLKIS